MLLHTIFILDGMKGGNPKRERWAQSDHIESNQSTWFVWYCWPTGVASDKIIGYLVWCNTLSPLLLLRIFLFLAIICTPPCLLVSNTTDIVAVDHGKAKVNSVILGLTRAVAIDVHFSLGFIFWSDVTELNIKRLRIGEENTTTVITNIGVCDGLAVQWRTSQLYWTDTTYNRISVSDLDGNNQLTLISSALEEPRAIALDPDNE